MRPTYLEPHHNGNLNRLGEETLKKLQSCAICPRQCKVNRLKNELGFCKTGALARVHSYLPHHGEEPPISGTRGSGTIFFARCNMACVYCQNYEFSQTGEGREVSSAELADFMLELQNLGCHNINLVTPTHVMPQILQALNIAAGKGLKIPLVYNTSGYELPETIKLLDGVVDIYLADMRYAGEEMAAKYSCANDYVKYNRQSLKEMHRQVGIAKINNKGIIERGLVIRHLVLPNNISGTAQAMAFVANELSPDTYISLMSQYAPYYKAAQFKEICRRISRQEYADAKKIMDKYGLHNGWTQEAHGLESFAGINIKPIHR